MIAAVVALAAVSQDRDCKKTALERNKIEKDTNQYVWGK